MHDPTRTTIRELIDSGKISLDTVVLGELPMTADGAVVSVGARVWFPGIEDALPAKPLDDVGLWVEFHKKGRHYDTSIAGIPQCYSTREAAERAAKEGK